MARLPELVAAYLESEGVATRATNLWADQWLADPDVAVGVIGNPGSFDYTFGGPPKAVNQRLQILTRAGPGDSDAAMTLAEDILGLLYDLTNVTIGDATVLSMTAAHQPVPYEVDDRHRTSMTTNYDIVARNA